MSPLTADLIVTAYTTFAVGLSVGWAEGAKLWQPYLLLQLGLYGVAVGWGRDDDIEELR